MAQPATGATDEEKIELLNVGLYTSTAGVLALIESGFSIEELQDRLEETLEHVRDELDDRWTKWIDGTVTGLKEEL